MSELKQDMAIRQSLVSRAMKAFEDDMKTVKRDGIEKVLEYINESDFMYAPASTQYHLHCEYGLLVHSYHVVCYLTKLNEMHGIKHIKIPIESILISGWFHDICKTNVYVEQERRRKNEKTNRWESYSGYLFKDDLPLGHGEKSVYMLSEFGLKLDHSEIAAINYHMGAFHFGNRYDRESSMQQAWKTWPLSLLLHVADTMATNIADVSAVV
ncbi:hydrolase [Candidatus Pacearchaeota archaeon]|nr:hydrolase [Candidatus Pacearchaeota archaeon]